MSIITTKRRNQASSTLLLEAADLILANARVQAFQRHYERQEYVSSQTIDNFVRQMSEAEVSYDQVTTTHGGLVTQADYTEYLRTLRRQQLQLLFDIAQKELAPKHALYGDFYKNRARYSWLYGRKSDDAEERYDFFPQKQRGGYSGGRWEIHSRDGPYNFAVIAYWAYLNSPFGAYFTDKKDKLEFLGVHLPERLVLATFMWCYFRVGVDAASGGIVLSLNDRVQEQRVAMEYVDEQSDRDNAAARRKFLEDNAAYIIYDREREEPTGNSLALDWDRPSYFFIVDGDVYQEKHFKTLTLIDLFKANLKPKRFAPRLRTVAVCMGQLCREAVTLATPDQRYGFCCDECFDASPFAIEY